MTGDVDVVIVTFNSASHLRDAVEAARAWARTGRVIVVDNASTDDSVSVARDIADVVIANDENVGFGVGQNTGAAEVQTSLFLALNPDAVVDAAGLERGYEILLGQHDIAAVQGVVRRSRDGGAERTHGREPGLADLVSHRFHLRQRLGEGVLRRAAPLLGLRYFTERVPANVVDTPFLAAVAPLIRRPAFDAVGGFDPGFFLYAEDIDLSRRLRNAGWRLVSLPVNWATHVGGASTATNLRGRETEWWRGHRRFVEQHWTGVRREVGLALSRERAR